LDNTLNQQTIVLPQKFTPEIAKAQEAWFAGNNSRRLWNGDAALWTGQDESDWLGWLDVAAKKTCDTDATREFARRLRTENFTAALLLGMGGSSLGPEVLAESLGSAPHYPRLHVLDSTDPQQVRRFEGGIDIARTLFIVSSKSGTTLETSVLMDYFLAKTSNALGAAASRHFVAITDPGSRLQKTAQERGFREIFLGVPSIGGRYSVLSHFGMVPLAASGHDVQAFLDDALVMARGCAPDVPPPQNPAVQLGLTIGVLAGLGCDKLTVICSPSIASFGAWAEQLIAESTGKNGKGVIPFANEPLGDASVYDSHRLFVFVRDQRNADLAQEHAVDAIERAGHPVVRIQVASPKRLGQEFFRFEIATAVAGAVLGINPFDQPDVEASKVAARAMTETFEKTGSLPPVSPVCIENDIALYTDEANARALRGGGAHRTLESWFKAHFDRLDDGDYFAVLAYLDATAPRIQALQGLRTAVRDRKRVATALQFGPRFLHSTGQAYKGGPNSGVFLQITAEPSSDLDIPGRKASFGVIESAQARGDLRVLAERDRRVLNAHIAGDVDAGLALIREAALRALS
jgi:transaldolase/glucose-6-phosphate isomerase